MMSNTFTSLDIVRFDSKPGNEEIKGINNRIARFPQFCIPINELAKEVGNKGRAFLNSGSVSRRYSVYV